jgi:hypothetical protein
VSGYVLALLLGAASAGSAMWKLTSMHYEHVIDVRAREAAAKVGEANQRAINAADDYEVWASLQRPKTITITREVEREVKADTDCSPRALPPRLRDDLTAAAADTDQLVAAGPVPAASAPSAYDLGGRGPGLFGRAGRVEGLPAAASSPR